MGNRRELKTRLLNTLKEFERERQYWGLKDYVRNLQRKSSLNGKEPTKPSFANLQCNFRAQSITKDIYEAKLKQYNSELQIIDDKLKRVDEVDKDFYITAEYILKCEIH